MSSLKFCPKCGSKLETEDQFCGECGYDLEAHDHVNPEAAQPTVAHPQTEPLPVALPPAEAPVNSQKTAIIILSVVLGLVIIIGGVVFWWFSRGSALLDQMLSSASQTTQNPVSLGLPSYSLNEGSYTAEQKVEINKPEGEGVQVYFTLDGTEPSEKSSRYETPLTLQSNTTLKSIAIDKNGNKSAVKTATYLITIQPPATDQAKLESTATTEASQESEYQKFGTYISGTWKITTMGRDYYYQFKNGILKIADAPEGTTDAGEYVEFTYSYDITPGNGGTVGTIYVEGTPIAIDCNPLGDNAIYINGYFATYSTSSFPFND